MPYSAIRKTKQHNDGYESDTYASHVIFQRSLRRLDDCELTVASAGEQRDQQMTDCNGLFEDSQNRLPVKNRINSCYTSPYLGGFRSINLVDNRGNQQELQNIGNYDDLCQENDRFGNNCCNQRIVQKEDSPSECESVTDQCGRNLSRRKCSHNCLEDGREDSAPEGYLRYSSRQPSEEMQRKIAVGDENNIQECSIR